MKFCEYGPRSVPGHFIFGHLGRSFGAKRVNTMGKIPPKSLFAIWAKVLAPKVQNMMKNYAQKYLCHLGRFVCAKSAKNEEKIPPKSLFAVWAEVLVPKV
jgi:hypothetical protein